MEQKHTVKAARSQTPASNGRTWLYVNMAVAMGLILVGLIFLFRLGSQQPANSSPADVSRGAPGSGQAAPDFTLASLSGSPVSLSDYSGQVVLINLWATWCPPCKAEMPDIHRFYEAHRAKGFTVLAINNQEDSETVRRFIQANGFTFPVLLDGEAEVLDSYQVRGLPTSFIIDRQGRIQHVQTGAITERQLEKIVLPLLSDF